MHRQSDAWACTQMCCCNSASMTFVTEALTCISLPNPTKVALSVAKHVFEGLSILQLSCVLSRL